MAAAGRARQGRPALSPHAGRRRGCALRVTPRGRSTRRAARLCSAGAERTYRLRCIDLDDAGGPAARTPPTLALGKARRDDKGAGARTNPVEVPGARPLSHLGAIRRQSRGGEGGEPRLFRQGAGSPLGGGVCLARRDPARARAAAPRPAPAGRARRPRPRSSRAWPKRV